MDQPTFAFWMVPIDPMAPDEDGLLSPGTPGAQLCAIPLDKLYLIKALHWAKFNQEGYEAAQEARRRSDLFQG